jgi:parvulin-like peptidyl-prolyl isomerase
MQSREIRRRKERKAEKPESIVEEKKIQHPFLYVFSVVILVIIVVTFIGVPVVNDMAGQGARIVFGTYDGVPIEYTQGGYFARQRDALAEQLRQQQQQPGQADNLELQAYQVWRSAFDQTVVHTAILQEARRSGLWVTDDRVDRTLIDTGPYVVNGQFSEELYSNTPNAERYAIRKMYREQIFQEQYVRDVLAGELQNDKEAEFFARMGETERSFQFVSYPFDGYPLSEVVSYGEQNRDKFRKIKLSRILVKSGQQEAQEIHKKLQDKTSSFEELARAHSKDSFAEKGGDMGWRYAYDLAQDFEGAEQVDTIFQLGDGAVSPPLESKFGWAIYRADEPAVNLDLQDPDSLKVVREYLMRYERGRVEDHFLTQAKGFAQAARESGFQPAAAAQQLAIRTTVPIPLNYQYLFQIKAVEAEGEGASIASAAYSEEFFQKAFALKQGEVSDPVPLEDQVVVLQLREERKLAGDERDFLKTYYRYYAGQTRQADLQETLVDPQKLEDNFNNVFYQKLYVRQ